MEKEVPDDTIIRRRKKKKRACKGMAQRWMDGSPGETNSSNKSFFERGAEERTMERGPGRE